MSKQSVFHFSFEILERTLNNSHGAKVLREIINKQKMTGNDSVILEFTNSQKDQEHIQRVFSVSKARNQRIIEKDSLAKRFNDIGKSLIK